MKFSELDIGDFFSWNGHMFIKIADNSNCNESLEKQYPNCIFVANLHYSVCGHDTKVKRVKSRKDFNPEND